MQGSSKNGSARGPIRLCSRCPLLMLRTRALGASVASIFFLVLPAQSIAGDLERAHDGEAAAADSLQRGLAPGERSAAAPHGHERGAGERARRRHRAAAVDRNSAIFLLKAFEHEMLRSARDAGSAAGDGRQTGSSLTRASMNGR